MKNLYDKIDSLKKELEKFEIIKTGLNVQDPKVFSIVYHEKTCHHNHTDGCSWFYEIKHNTHNWDSFAHKEFLRKSEELISLVGYEMALILLEKGFLS